MVPFIAGIVLAGACDGSGEGPGSASPVCSRYEQLTPDLAEPSEDEQARAAREVLGDDVPTELAVAASVLDDTSASSDERKEALDEVGEWLLVECGGPVADDVRLVPTEVPEGLALCSTLDLPAFEAGTDAPTTAIWGDAALADPWAGPLVALWTIEADELYGHEDAEDVTVHGVSGSVAPMPLFQAVSSAEWGHIVTWREPSGLVVEVAARGASPAEALRIAELVVLGNDAAPSLPADALGPETTPIYEGVGISPLGIGTTGWSLQYKPDDVPGAEDLRLLAISGSPGASGDLETLRFWALTTQPIEIRNEDGLEYAAFDAEAGPFGIAWQDAPGVIVQVVGLGLDQQTVREVTESLEEIDADEWRGLKQDAVDSGCIDSSSPDGGDDLA